MLGQSSASRHPIRPSGLPSGGFARSARSPGKPWPLKPGSQRHRSRGSSWPGLCPVGTPYAASHECWSSRWRSWAPRSKPRRSQGLAPRPARP